MVSAVINCFAKPSHVKLETKTDYQLIADDTSGDQIESTTLTSAKGTSIPNPRIEVIAAVFLVST